MRCRARARPTNGCAAAARIMCLFKICSTFDSTDAGNIGPVMDALRADSGDAIVLVTPAFPETSRTVYQGNLFVGSVPLNESPLKDHPLNPMHDSNLVRVLARQSKTKIGLVDLATVVRGTGSGAGASGRSLRQGHWRRHHRCGVRSRSGDDRRRCARPSVVGWRIRHRARPCACPGGAGQGRRHAAARSRKRRSADLRRALPAVVRRRHCSRSPTPKT